MEWMEQIGGQIAIYISVPYILIVMLLSYLIKENFQIVLQNITRFKWKTVYTVLVLATIVAIPFLIWSDEGWVKILFSYALATSAHEILFGFIESKIKKK